METGRHSSRQVDCGKRLSGQVACVDNDETSSWLILLVYETEDESVFFRFAMRVCHEKRLTYG